MAHGIPTRVYIVIDTLREKAMSKYSSNGFYLRRGDAQTKANRNNVGVNKDRFKVVYADLKWMPVDESNSS